MPRIPEKKFHPLSELFPLLPPEDLELMVDDVKANGLNNAIILYDGMILDGRNRYLACKKAGVTPYFEDFDGTYERAQAFVISQNLSRRHLTTSQRAMIAAEIATRKKGEKTNAGQSDNRNGQYCPLPEPPTVKDAAEQLNVGERTVKEAKKVLEEGTKKQVEDVKAGEKTVHEAAEEIKEKQKKKAEKPRQTVKGESLKDALGVEVPDLLRDVFGDPWLKTMIAAFLGARLTVDAEKWTKHLVGKSVPYVKYLRTAQALEYLAEARRQLQLFCDTIEAALPHCVCPNCQGAKCDQCRSTGWLPLWRMEELSNG